MTEAELVGMIAARFTPPEYATIPQVRNGTGYTRKTTRTADALAMSLWPSRGLGLYGFEVKCSRSDWRTELKNPAKAEDIQRFCHRWYVVTATESIIQPGELPATWGWFVATGAGGLKCKVEAPVNKDAQPLDIPMLCAIFRKVQETMISRLEVQPFVAAEVKKKAEARDWQHERLKEAVEAFEKASGVSVRDHWNAEPIGDAVKQVLAAKMNNAEWALKQLEICAQRVLDNIEHCRKESAKQVDGKEGKTRRRRA